MTNPDRVFRGVYEGLGPYELYDLMIRTKARDDDLVQILRAARLSDPAFRHAYMTLWLMTNKLLLFVTPLLVDRLSKMRGLLMGGVLDSEAFSDDVWSMPIDLSLASAEGLARGEQLTRDGKWSVRVGEVRATLARQVERGTRPDPAIAYRLLLLEAAGIWRGLSRFAASTWGIDPMEVMMAEARRVADKVRPWLPILEQGPFDPAMADEVEQLMTATWTGAS